MTANVVSAILPLAAPVPRWCHAEALTISVMNSRRLMSAQLKRRYLIGLNDHFDRG